MGQNLLNDPGFENEKSAWTFTKRYGVRQQVLKDGVHSGKQAVKLSTFNVTDRFATLSQKQDLKPGVYEFACRAKGNGIFRLNIKGEATRSFTTSPEWALYSLVFELTEAAPVTVMFEVQGATVIDDAFLSAADDKLQVAWERQQKALQQFYYIPSGYSAQRSAPNAPKQKISDRKPVPITDKVIFFDPRYESSWNTKCDKIAGWFERRGFTVKSAPSLVKWMEAAIDAERAYGSVVVMSMGLVPEMLVTPLNETCVLHRYMNAGGRVVWTGDTALYVAQAETGPIYVLGKKGSTDLIGLCWTPGLDGTPSLTDAGKRWGLNSAGTTSRAVPAPEVTLSLSESPSGAAAVWLKTINPAYPLSGFIASVFQLSGDNTTALEDFYRLALFTGEPVEIPKPETPETDRQPFTLAIESMAEGKARRAFVRGETVNITTTLAGDAPTGKITLALTDQAPPFLIYDQADLGVESAVKAVADYAENLKERTALWTHSPATGETSHLLTAQLATGDYLLQAVLTSPDGKQGATVNHPIAICPKPNLNGIYFGTRGPSPNNAYRFNTYLMELKRLKLQGLEGGSSSTLFADALLYYGMTFVPHFDPRDYLTEKRVDKDGNLVPNPWGGGKLGLVGIAGEKAREKARKGMKSRAAAVAGFPSLSNVFTTSDDFSALGGADYCDANLEEFKESTGLEAPRAETANPGIIPNDDPWLLWHTFLSRDVLGRFNHAVGEGLEAGSPGAKVWPVPGGAQWPLFSTYSAQYPPFNFGETGFNTVGYYCYLNYWAPTLTYLYWSEVARLGNRDLPVWVMPDAGNTRHYLRNQAHTLLAGNTKGIVYFIYSWMGKEGRKEIADIGALLESHGPLLRKLKPAPKKAALLVPFSQNIYNKDYTLRRARQAFNDLVQNHMDVELVAEEELGSLKYSVIFLAGVTHLRSSTVEQLERLATGKTSVVVDKDTIVPVAGARKLAMSLGDVAYGSQERRDHLAQLKQALASYELVAWDSPEATTLVRPFVGPEKETFLYLVDLDTAGEYSFYRRNVYEVNTFGRDPDVPRDEVKNFIEKHGMQSHLKTTEMTVVFPADRLPEGWQVVDLYSGTSLPVEAADHGRLKVTTTTRRFGGTLLALRPTFQLDVQMPTAVERGKTATFKITLPGLRGTAPLHVTLTNPDGRIDPEISGYYAPEAGQPLTLHFQPGINAPTGTWKLDVRELGSGIQTDPVITVK